MPDITMCVNAACPLRGECYRYRAIPTTKLGQSWAHFEPKNDECEKFLPFWEGSRIRPVEEVDLTHSPRPEPNDLTTQRPIDLDVEALWDVPRIQIL